jgi:hypothetical protein
MNRFGEPGAGRRIALAASTPGPLERLRARLRSLTPRQTLALVGLAALGVLLIFFIVTRVVPRPLRATVYISGGEVIVLNRQMGTFRTYYDGDLLKVQAGDQLIAVDGSAQVELFPSQVAFVQPGAHVKLAELDDDLGGTHAEFFVHRGALRSVVNHPLASSDRYAVASVALTASSAGADYVLTAVSATEADVVVYEGTVLVERGDETLTLNAGQAVHAVAETPLAAQPANLVAPGATPAASP